MVGATPSLNLAAVSGVNSLRVQVSEALRAALVSGQMRPGVRYSARSLGEMLGVSATPVREAMLDLVREGLVEVECNKGYRVTVLTDEQLDQFAQARLLLEVPTMGDVATDPTPETIDALEALRRPARAIDKAAAEQDFAGFIRLDTEFHCTFLALAGNEEIVNIVRDLRNRSRLYGLEAVARTGVLESSAGRETSRDAGIKRLAASFGAGAPCRGRMMA